MKKLMAFCAAIAACVAFAALDFGAVQTISVLPPTSIGSGATNSTALILGNLKGRGEILVSATGADARTALNVTLWATNSASGGWTSFAAETFAATNAGVYRVAFPGIYLTKDAKVTISSIGAATTASAVIISY